MVTWISNVYVSDVAAVEKKEIGELQRQRGGTHYTADAFDDYNRQIVSTIE